MTTRKSIDGFDLYEIFEIHSGNVVEEIDHPVRAKFIAADMTEDNAEHGHVYAVRLAA